jgi:hypothetical protein
MPYGHWIPSDAKDALMAVFLLGGERDQLLAAMHADHSSSSNVNA